MLRKGRITFRDLYELLTDKDAVSLVSLWMDEEDARRAHDDSVDFLRFQKHTAALLDNVSDFAAVEVRDRLCAPYADIELAEAHAKNLVVVFELNSQMRPRAATTLARMALEDLKHFAGSLGHRPASQKPFHIYLDEAGRAVYPGFAGLIAQCRSAGIGLTLAAQAPDNFDTEEGKLMTTVLQNSGTKLILRQLDPESAQLCANLGGTYQVMERTRQLGDQGLLGIGETGAYSEHEVDKFHAHPNTLKASRTAAPFSSKAPASASSSTSARRRGGPVPTGWGSSRVMAATPDLSLISAGL